MTTIDGLIYYADLDEFWTGFMNRALRGSGLSLDPPIEGELGSAR